MVLVLEKYDEVNPSQIFPPGYVVRSFPTALVNDLIEQLNGQDIPIDVATVADMLAGTEPKVILADVLQALWKKGADVAAAASMALGDGGLFVVTGSGANIAGITFTQAAAGRTALLYFNDSNTLVHSANLVLPGATNFVTGAGDVIEVICVDSATPIYLVNIFDAEGNVLPVGRASTTQVLGGVVTDKVATPDAIAALWEKGADIASAATISIGEGGYFHVTGTTGISDVDFATNKSGRLAWLIFDGAVLLTHSASFQLPGAADITTAAGDRLLVGNDDGVDAVIGLIFVRANGQTVFGTASTTEVLAGVDTVKLVTPDALASLWEKGSNVASAATISLGEGGLFHITGTTDISDIDFATAKDGRRAILLFDGAAKVVNSTTLKIDGGEDWTPTVGDAALVWQDNGDTVYLHPMPQRKLYRYIQTVRVTSSTTYNRPANVNALFMRGCSAGGGGGGAQVDATNPRAGAGGGGGAVTEKWITAPATSYSITIGAGGTAGANTGGTGGNGGVLQVGSIIDLAGGSGGGGMVAGAANVMAASGAGGAVTTGGDLSYSGDGGDPGINIGGGQRRSGKGGNSPFGYGGEGQGPAGAATSVAGVNGKGYGSGGSGAMGGTGAGNTGGVGAGAYLEIEEYALC